MDNNSLEHHGILGQKWGIRRFQNRDGSLTPAGLKRVKQDFADRHHPKGSTMSQTLRPRNKLSRLGMKTVIK